MARQKSTSKPDQFPFSSTLEKPGRPVLTPHSTASRRTVLLRVCVSYRSKAIAAAATAIATAKPINRPDRKFRAKSFRMFYLAAEGCIVRSQFRLLPDDDLGPDRNSIVQIDHLALDQPAASRHDLPADSLRLIDTVDAIDGGAKRKRPRAQ